MYDETIAKLTTAAQKKNDLLNSSIFKYLISSAFAGSFIGFGILLIFNIASFASGSPMVKILMGVSFSVALSLVIFTGTDLFTGNNLIMTVGKLNKGVKTSDLMRVWIFSYFGNFIGALLLSLIFVGAGFAKGPIAETFQNMSLAKAGAGFMPLLFRGILCNMLVCLAVLISFRTNDDTAKLIIIFLCLYTFITCGFEHSIANMTVYGVSLLSPDIRGVGMAEMFANLIPVTIGNIIGGAFILGCGYFSLGSKSFKNR
ncbi:MAG: formate/nitrite transporter family protein [Coriobacteriia bacterium]|nr:formate/nitrite transporter family protein [Coriobacteriia bacterium]